MNATVKTIGIVIAAMIIYKIADKLFLDKAFSSMGFYEED